MHIDQRLYTHNQFDQVLVFVSYWVITFLKDFFKIHLLKTYLSHICEEVVAFFPGLT